MPLRKGGHASAVLEDFRMETIYFLIFVGVCAFAVVWATRSSKSKTNLAAKSSANRDRKSSEKLMAPSDSRLAHRELIWEERRKRAARGYTPKQTFVPKSVAGTSPEYDGYSRRDRHHVAPTGAVKEEAHIDDGKHATQM
jgi:hypothetical protein